MDDHTPAPADDALRRKMKAELRKRMRGLRNTLPASACAERSARIVERLLSFEPMARARSVALFWPIVERHEIDLRALDTGLRERGARVAYPTIDPDTSVMTFRFVSRPDAMIERGLGFHEPDASEPDAPPGTIDVVVVPALAVDPRGYRVGYGAGYYDRTLPVYAPPAVAVAVAFEFQLLAELPVTPGDAAVAWVITDARTLSCRSDA